MAKNFGVLRAQMSPASHARVEAKAQAMLAEMPLNELRQARGLSQKMLAEVLHVQQPAIAKMEKRTDSISPRCAATSGRWGVSWRSWRASRMARSRSAIFPIWAAQSPHKKRAP